ncbi:hypothetical protein AYI69_g8676, partial [Smittium culicis]
MPRLSSWADDEIELPSAPAEAPAQSYLYTITNIPFALIFIVRSNLSNAPNRSDLPQRGIQITPYQLLCFPPSPHTPFLPYIYISFPYPISSLDYQNDYRQPREEVPFPTEPPYNAYIENLPYEVTEDDIANAFAGLEVITLPALS